MSNKSTGTDKPNRRGRPPKSEQRDNHSDNGQDVVKPTRAAKPKLGYRVYFMPITDAIDAAMVSTPDGETILYLRDGSNLWSKVQAETGFFAVLSKGFKMRNSGARLIGQFLYAEDVSLPVNHRKQPLTDNSYDAPDGAPKPISEMSID